VELRRLQLHLHQGQQDDWQLYLLRLDAGRQLLRSGVQRGIQRYLLTRPPTSHLLEGGLQRRGQQQQLRIHTYWPATTIKSRIRLGEQLEGGMGSPPAASVSADGRQSCRGTFHRGLGRTAISPWCLMTGRRKCVHAWCWQIVEQSTSLTKEVHCRDSAACRAVFQYPWHGASCSFCSRRRVPALRGIP
jgi:hypothetical protein